MSDMKREIEAAILASKDPRTVEEVALGYISDLRETIAFFSSVIRGGEKWSAECENHMRRAFPPENCLAAVRRDDECPLCKGHGGDLFKPCYACRKMGSVPDSEKWKEVLRTALSTPGVYTDGPLPTPGVYTDGPLHLRNEGVLEEILAKQVIAERKRADAENLRRLKVGKWNREHLGSIQELEHRLKLQIAEQNRYREQRNALQAEIIEERECSAKWDSFYRRACGELDALHKKLEERSLSDGLVFAAKYKETDDAHVVKLKDRIALLEKLLREACEHTTPRRYWSEIIKDAFGDDA